MGSAFHTALCQGTPRSKPLISQENKQDSEMATPLASSKQKVKQRTPIRSVFTNPFEVGLADRLHLPAMSPSIFSQNSTTEENERSFRWSIEQMAVLHPAEIDDIAISQDSVTCGFDTESEQKAQEAINCFFSQRHIVPSPWLHCTPSYKSISLSTSSKATEATNTTNTVEKKDAFTQTTLTLPIDLDLEKLLGNYCTFQSEKSKSEGEDGGLSLSTLRRKLFFQDDDLRHVHNESPVYNLQSSTEENFELTPTSASSVSKDHLSSSPAINIKRTSNSPMLSLSPPTVSPIGKSYSPTSSIDQNLAKNLVAPIIPHQIAIMPSFEPNNTNQKILSYIEVKSTYAHEITGEGTLFTSTLPSSDLGYHTYRSTSDDTEPNKIQPSTLFPHSPKENDFRMSWAPIQSSTPAHKHDQDQDAMCVDTSLIS